MSINKSENILITNDIVETVANIGTEMGGYPELLNELASKYQCPILTVLSKSIENSSKAIRSIEIWLEESGIFDEPIAGL